MAKNDVATVAAQGFQQAAKVYEQARPSYPSEVIDLIKSLCDKPDIIVDVGAGTGKLTRLLGPIGAKEIVAVEPVEGMRENLKNIPIITKIIDGTAESIPLDDHTVDIIVCAQAFHWFATERTLAEFNRVLKPTGSLVLVWNIPAQLGYEWADKVTQYVESYAPEQVLRFKSMEWQKIFDNQNYFSSLQHKEFSHTTRVPRDLALKGIQSISYIAVLSAEQQKQVIDDVEKILNNVEEMRDAKEFDIQHVANVYWCSPIQKST